MSDEDLEQTLERLGITDDQFSTVAAFVGLMTLHSGEEVFKLRAKDWGIPAEELAEIRIAALDMFILNSRALDEQEEADGTKDTRVDENGVIGPLIHEDMTKCVVHYFNTGDADEAAEIANAPVDAVAALAGSFEARLVYIGAEAIKTNPEFDALDIMTNLSDPEQFCDWFEAAADRMEMVEEAAEDDDSFEVEG